MSVFFKRLKNLVTPVGQRRWIYVPYDQLTADIGPLTEQPAHQTGIVLIETPAKAARRPYHKQKLALILANQRHFALEQASRGVAVRYVVSKDGYAAALSAMTEPLIMMEAAERELRVELQPLIDRGSLRLVPHAGWLTKPALFSQLPGPPWRMDAFYRLARNASGVLMDAGKPRGGKWSYDGENRLPWKGTPAAPEPPRFTPDDITIEVGELIRTRFEAHPGELDLTTLPATAADAAHLWRWAIEHCLPWFGPFEDAMSRRSTGLFHTRIAPLLNIHRLLPQTVIDEVTALPLPLASQEGFIRQILGWREFVRHVHVSTDGFRTVPANILGNHAALPPTYWPGAPSGLACLDRVVEDVWRDGYSHHITRLMVLANIALLLDVDPRHITEWFWVAYSDAFEWLVEPNVMAMGSFATGTLMTTKPYLGGGAYIHRMSDHCQACRFDPAKNCPITTLYWDWFRRHGEAVQGNPRMTTILAGHAKRGAPRHAIDQLRADDIRRQLASGTRLSPESLG